MQYKGFTIQICDSDIYIRDTKGNIIISVDTVDDATDYFNNL